MKKMAVFVEGQTEQAFIEELLREVANRREIHIDTVKAHGGRVCPRTFVEVEATCRPNPAKRFYVIIYDSSHDSRVLSDIRDNYENLVAQGYSDIIGLRDVYPLPETDIPAIRANFTALAPSVPVICTLVLGVMEVEAWFVAEYSHYARMDARLGIATVVAALGYNPETHDVQIVAQPSEDLKRAYMAASLGYNKSKRHVQRTVGALDYAYIYLGLGTRFPDVATLVTSIDRFLT